MSDVNNERVALVTRREHVNRFIELMIERGEEIPDGWIGAPPAPNNESLRGEIAAEIHRQIPGCEHDEHGDDCMGLTDALLPIVERVRAADQVEIADLKRRLAVAAEESFGYTGPAADSGEG